MAVYSMTGYASASSGGAAPRSTGRAEGVPAAETQASSGGVTAELRSVNGRFLDLSMRLPDELRGKRFYSPSGAGFEEELARRLAEFRKRKS